MNNENHAGRDGSHRDKLFSEKCHLKLVIEQPLGQHLNEES